jgi:general stress protein 26
MARQEVEASDELWFITARSSGLVDAIRSEPMVALTFSSRDSWVSLVGRAAIVDDREKLADLWNTFAEAWLPGGPDDPEAALLRVDIDSAEYWDTPGGKIASLLSFAKTKLTGDTYDTEHGKLRP